MQKFLAAGFVERAEQVRAFDQFLDLFPHAIERVDALAHDGRIRRGWLFGHGREGNVAAARALPIVAVAGRLSVSGWYVRGTKAA